MHGHPIAKEMEAWWAEHGGRADHPEWIEYVNDFGSLLIDKLMEMSEEHDNAGRFGMSKAGGCTRAAALKLLGYAAEPLSGSTRATFAIGHILEVKALATLRACGYPVDGRQRRVTIEPLMSSASDGVMELDGLPAIVSVKSIGYKMSGKRYARGGVNWTRHGFAELPAAGIRASHPDHWAQLQAEMHGSGVQQALILYVAKDMVKAMEADPMMQENGSLTFYAERVPYDVDFCRADLVPVWSTQWNAARSSQPGPARYYTKYGRWVTLDPRDANGNKELTGTYDPCSYCDLRNACTVGAPLAASVAHQPEVAHAQ